MPLKSPYWRFTYSQAHPFSSCDQIFVTISTSPKYKETFNKAKWDRSFEKSKYTADSNMVNEVLENSGCMLREATSDRYTHEICGNYVTADFFPMNMVVMITMSLDRGKKFLLTGNIFKLSKILEQLHLSRCSNVQSICCGKRY